MEGIEKIILKMLPNQEGRNKFFIFSLQNKWEEICGQNVAKHSKAVRLERKVLYINTDSSVWANHLLMMKQQFINNINMVLPGYPIKDIKFFTGSIEKFFFDKKEERAEKLDFLPLTEAEQKSISEKIEPIRNEELKKTLAHFRKACLQREKALLSENNNLVCKSCGTPLIKKGSLCRVCERYEKEKQHDLIVALLTNEPWLNYEDCKKQVKCDKILFDNVKILLEQYYFDKVYSKHATPKEELVAVVLKTGLTPEKINDQLMENVLKNLRRK